MLNEEFAMFPLGRPCLPDEVLPLRVFEDRYVIMMERLLLDDEPQFGVVMIDRGSEVGGGDARRSIGTAMSLARVERSTRNDYSVLAVAQRRIRVVRWLEDDPYPRAIVEDFPDQDEFGRHEFGQVALEAFPRVQRALGAISRTDPFRSMTLDRQIFGLVSALPVGPLDLQDVLEAPSVAKRASVVEEILEHLHELGRFATS